jgi:hypothetical protein
MAESPLVSRPACHRSPDERIRQSGTPEAATELHGALPEACFRQAEQELGVSFVPLASSGPMEKGVDLVVARRFKTRGMSWFHRGASPLLHLRLLRLNGTWARYWAGRFAAVLRPWPSPA